jgi:phosphoribosylpyrophosphate synthetase
LFLDIFSEFQGKSDIVAVSPDAGGLKFVLKFSEMMDLGHAVMNKYRYTKDSSSLLGVVGALDGKKKAVILDDETVTGSSLINAGRALKDNYSIDEIHAAVSHLKITKNRISSIIDANKNGYLTTLNVTDSIPQPDYIKDLPFVKIYGLSKRIATVINMLHYNQSVKALLHRR